MKPPRTSALNRNPNPAHAAHPNAVTPCPRHQHIRHILPEPRKAWAASPSTIEWVSRARASEFQPPASITAAHDHNSLYITTPNGYGVELTALNDLTNLPREVWECDIDAAT